MNCALIRLGQVHDAARGLNLIRRFYENHEDSNIAALADTSKESAVAIISLMIEGLRCIARILENHFE